jgi:hypothetical protein
MNLWLSLLAMGAAAQETAAPNQPQFLAWTDGLPRPTTEHVEISGRGGPGIPFRVDINRNTDTRRIRIETYAGGNSLGTAEIPIEEFSQIALETAQVGFDNRETLEVTVKYGNTRECFYNDDGRNRLRFVFNAGERPVVFNSSFEGCSLSTEELPPS